MFGFFGGGNDWNIIAVIFERKDNFRVNGNRAKGGAATKTRDGAKEHSRTILWAVFDQKRTFIEGSYGPGHALIAKDSAERLKKELPQNITVQQVLQLLERGEMKVAKPLAWGGYPKEEKQNP